MKKQEEAWELIEEYLRQQMHFYRIPALAIVLTDREKTLFSGYYGFSDLEREIPLTKKHIFNFGSIGKSFTSILLLQAAEEGLIDLQAEVTQYLPWFEVQTEYRAITLHDLMTHSSGLPMGTDMETEALGEVWNLRYQKTGFAPGEHFHYSNSGYKTLGLVLEKVYGKPYAELVQEKILDPMGMRDTLPCICSNDRPRYVRTFTSQFDDRPINPVHLLVPEVWLETSTADGCINATPEDLAIYTRALLNRGEGLLEKESFAAMTTPHTPFEDMGYGYGLMIKKHEDYTQIGHSGSIPGYGAFMDMDMDNGLGMVIMMVTPTTGGLRQLPFDVFRAAVLEKDLPPLLDELALYKVENTETYCGEFVSELRTIKIVQEDEYLWLDDGFEKNRLEPRGKDKFYIDHPEYALFLLKFVKSDEKTEALEIYYGAERFRKSGLGEEAVFPVPAQYLSFAGHYRAQNPWLGNFRVVLRKATLWLIYPEGSEMELIPEDDFTFMLKENNSDALVERITFSAMVNKKAIIADLSGCEYYRFFTP